jgi:Protein of unknown function (DUF2905)
MRICSGPAFVGGSLIVDPATTSGQWAASLYRYLLKSNENGITIVGRLLIALGVALVVAGVIVLVLERAGLGFGRMPGDFSYRGRSVQIWFPLGTCIVLSVVLSVVLYLLSKLRR